MATNTGKKARKKIGGSKHDLKRRKSPKQKVFATTPHIKSYLKKQPKLDV